MVRFPGMKNFKTINKVIFDGWFTSLQSGHIYFSIKPDITLNILQVIDRVERSPPVLPYLILINVLINQSFKTDDTA